MGKFALRTSVADNGLRRDWTNDISTWKYLSPEPRGTRVKSILKRGNTQFLFKVPNDPNESMSEIFNSILANELQINHVQYFPAMYQSQIGVVCERFLKSTPEIEELMEMKELLYRHSARLQKFSPIEYKEIRGRDPEAVAEQSIDNIYLVLGEECGEAKNIFGPFFRMLGFDALIGHTDRHWENYGLVLGYSKKKRIMIKLAPLYDTVTAYLVGSATDERLEKMLKSELKDPKWYMPRRNDNSKIKVPGNPQTNHFELVQYIVDSPAMGVYENDVLWAFRQFKPKVVKQIMKRFFPDVSEVRKAAITEILCQRQRLGLSIKKSI